MAVYHARPEAWVPGLASQLPGKSEYGAWVDKLGLGKAAAIFSAVSVAAVAVAGERVCVGGRWVYAKV